MTDLCKLATKYGTDKAGWYTPVYDLLLGYHRAGVRKVMEIGVGTPEAMQHVPGYKPGASLRMWHDYFPSADVYGADIVPSEWCTFQLDQGNEAQLRDVGKLFRWDLIVDDGSHQPHHQILTANTLRPYLRKGGLLIIEDVNNFDEVSKGLKYPALCISYPNTGNPAARCMVIRG